MDGNQNGQNLEKVDYAVPSHPVRMGDMGLRRNALSKANTPVDRHEDLARMLRWQTEATRTHEGRLVANCQPGSLAALIPSKEFNAAALQRELRKLGSD